MTMPFDVSQVDWVYVCLLALFVFVASFVGSVLSFGRRGLAAVVAAILFSVIFVFWSYYPHGVPFLPTSMAAHGPAAASGNAPTAATSATPPQKPSNPVSDITPRTSQ